MRYIRALMLGITLVALVAACGGYALLRELRAPAAEGDDSVVEIVVEAGDSTSMIATKLRRENLIRQPILFTILARSQGLDGQLQAGSYLLQPSMTMGEILASLQSARVEEIAVTIPEGLRLEEIAARVAATGVVDEASFLSVARDGTAFRSRYFLLNSLPAGASLEGYLFPDTYRIGATSTVTEIVGLMLDRFNEQYSAIERDIRVPNRTVHEIVTMASVVQREAARIDEMPRIASVFWNRLKPEFAAETGGGKLQADPTVQYALGYSQQEQTWWRKELTLENLAIASPYNTRELAGLPPGPISSPGLDALRAAAQPEEAGFLYFVASCANDGSHQFASNFDEFQRYAADYAACSGQ